MKTISPITIWDKGTSKQATILNAYAVNVTLNTSATFYWEVSTTNQDGLKGELLSQGNLSMAREDYVQWDIDQDAWDYIAKCLNLTITGDYIAPIIEESIADAPIIIAEAPIIEEPTTEV